MYSIMSQCICNTQLKSEISICEFESSDCGRPCAQYLPTRVTRPVVERPCEFNKEQPISFNISVASGMDERYDLLTDDVLLILIR